MLQLCFKMRNGSSQWNNIIRIETNRFRGNRNHMKSNSAYHHKFNQNRSNVRFFIILFILECRDMHNWLSDRQGVGNPPTAN